MANSVLTPFPDIERVLVVLLGAIEGVAGAGAVTPSNLGADDSMPFIRVQRTGGGDDLITDSAKVSIDAFGATRDDAYSLAEQIRQILLKNPIVANGYVIDHVATGVGPTDIPWGADASNVRRFNASYTLSVRRPS